MSSKGAWVSITAPVTLTTAAITNYVFNTPTGALTINSTSGPQGLSTVGTAKYNVTALGTSIVLAGSDNSATAWGTPGVLIQEGLDETTSRQTVAVRMAGDVSYNRVDIASSPSFSGTVTSNPTVSGSTQNRYMDQYGSYVVYDSTAPGTFSLSFPSTQAKAVVGVGKSPASSGAAGGGSVETQTVLPITADVVKLDSEISSTDKSGKDMVLFGGSCINSLVAQLASDGKFPYTCSDWPGRDFGRIEVIEDAFATGKMALVIAGTRAVDTDLAALVVQKGFPGATTAQKGETALEVTGSVSSPAYSA
jgi:hypothetical protein